MSEQICSLHEKALALVALGTEIRIVRLDSTGSWVVVGGSLHRYCVSHDVQGVAKIVDAVNHFYPSQVAALAALAAALGLEPDEEIIGLAALK